MYVSFRILLVIIGLIVVLSVIIGPFVQLLGVIGFIIAFFMAWYTFQPPNAEVTVKCVPDKHISSVDGTIHIIVANVGNKNIKVDLPNVLLDDEHKFDIYMEGHKIPQQARDYSYLLCERSEIDFPHLLIPRDYCKVRVRLADLSYFLKQNKYNGEVNVRFQFLDGISKKKYESDAYPINVDKILKDTKVTWIEILKEQHEFER